MCVDVSEFSSKCSFVRCGLPWWGYSNCHTIFCVRHCGPTQPTKRRLSRVPLLYLESTVQECMLRNMLLPDCNLIVSKHQKPTFSIRFSEDKTLAMSYNLRTLAALPINIKREGEERRGRSRIHSVPGQAPGPCGRPHCHCQSSEHEPWN